MKTNKIKKGAYIMLKCYSKAIMNDNRNGSRREVTMLPDGINVTENTLMSIPVTQIESVYVCEEKFPKPGNYCGKWVKVEVNKTHKRRLENVKQVL
jgi:hypothetical protein